jgi:exonuclease VII large subunit
LDSKRQQLQQLMAARISSLRARVEGGERALGHLGPTQVLERGYSITSLEGTTVPLKDATRVHGGQALLTRLARGEVRSLVSTATAAPRVAARMPDRQPSLFDETTDTGETPEETE